MIFGAVAGWPPGVSEGLEAALILLMIKILHYLKHPKLWESWYSPIMGDAGLVASAVVCVQLAWASGCD